mmetsp:Transcript_3532/g.467  ORF Transcript_3532/g.467 Transcript_3532/m.467 type:complete len:100 (-) Transcript_3532:482-781(-)
MLLTLFLLKDYIEIILTALVSIASCSSIIFVLTFVFANCFNNYSCYFRTTEVKVKHIIITVLALSILALYIVTRNWILNNVLGIAYIFTVLRTVKLQSL